MTGRRAIVGLCIVSAVAFSACAVQSAGATTKGTTAFTCVEGKGALKGEHCLTTGSGSATFGHVAIAEETTTELIATNAKTASETTAAAAAVLKATIAGVPVELKATGVAGTGLMRNAKAPSGQHYVEAWPFPLVFSGVTVAKPEGKGCKVFDEVAESESTEGVITTESLTGTTESQGDFVKVTRFAGSSTATIATFFITCNKGGGTEALEGKWTVTGNFQCPTSGATVVCKHEEVTTQNTLKAKGSKAGFEGALTFSGRVFGSGSAYTPLSATTVETP
jgi:hypothetical protein